MKIEREIKTADEMMALGAELAGQCADKCVIYLKGDLGAGKTTLVRGFLMALGHKGKVKSPTYTLVEPYNLNGKQIYHFDLYRLNSPDELEYIGVRDYFSATSISLIEWPERGKGMLPEADVICKIEVVPRGRHVQVEI
ncbi:MAG: tRNA (adenosine(37)-N6)-threonylcarbamoyltransferase complex ATPase subunit type 1 TsaE [Gammaproteobacteria bacterium]|nr:tRNA (adenosine(37)-N6)-threonylcarbamoyltransferase complex ATPase subunit type 1 TsaE [Gammaproteobacteria bacterium]